MGNRNEQVTDWLLGFDEDTFDLIMPAIDALSEQGPTLGRPLADRVKDSRHHNMKELRSAGRNIRVLFAFDPDRAGHPADRRRQDGQVDRVVPGEHPTR
jgi:hypothetical protein